MKGAKPRTLRSARPLSPILVLMTCGCGSGTPQFWIILNSLQVGAGSSDHRGGDGCGSFRPPSSSSKGPEVLGPVSDPHRGSACLLPAGFGPQLSSVTKLPDNLTKQTHFSIPSFVRQCFSVLVAFFSLIFPFLSFPLVFSPPSLPSLVSCVSCWSPVPFSFAGNEVTFCTSDRGPFTWSLDC